MADSVLMYHVLLSCCMTDLLMTLVCTLLVYYLLPTLTQVLESHEQLATPVFLRFTNMMINDATVQLDEGLDVCKYLIAGLALTICSNDNTQSQKNRLEKYRRLRALIM